MSFVFKILKTKKLKSRASASKYNVEVRFCLGMETCDQNAVDGFSFSQDLTSELSQMYSQMSQSTDSGFYGDSQSLKDSQSLSQSFGAVPQKRPFFDQMVPPSFPEVKKAKYNLPKWTKGLLKNAEETQKLKSHDVLLRRQEEENG